MIVTAIPLYHIFALMVNFITYFSVGADNWLVPNPRDFDSFIDTMKKARPERLHGREHALCRAGGAPEAARRSTGPTCSLAGGGGAAVIARRVGQVAGA